MARLELHFLGPFHITLDGEPITTFESVKVRALLAYLAAEAPRPQPRERLAGLLWPGWPQRSAMSNLRYALADLRKNLRDREAQPPFLLVSRESIQLNPEAGVWVDVAEFEQLAVSARELHGNQPSAISSLPNGVRAQSSIALYRGEFLEGFVLNDSPAFEEWILAKREYFKRHAMDALHALAEEARQRGEYEQALAYARRQLELEPWQEEAHRQVMRLLALTGQRSAALAQYETCRRMLKAELGIEPSEETTQLYEQIRGGNLATPPSPPAFHQIGEPKEPEPSSFVARQAELARLKEGLERALAGKGQVVFITGSPGLGKTSLAQEFIRQSLQAHPDLAAASGNCQAYFGKGDPYLPFREVLAMLTGQVEERWAAGTITQPHASRLWRFTPHAVKALVEEGPALIDTFIPGAPLLRRAAQAAGYERRSSRPEHSLEKPAWLERLEAIVRYRQQLQSGEHIGDKLHSEQEALFYQYRSVLRALARHTPLILFLDDLQWADLGSLSLLFTLGRGIVGARILIVGAYRPGEFPSENLHHLAAILNELRLLYPDPIVNLDQAEERSFIDAYLDSAPNRLGVSFREMLFRQTRAHPLYTVELLRGMQERGELMQNQEGEWVEGSAIHWDILPGRVEAAIAERMERLPQELREYLQIASVEGEGFTVEVIAQVQGSDPRTLLKDLSEALDRRQQLVRAESIVRIDGRRLSRYRFRHILFQKYLYSRLDAVMRADLHEQVGLALERLYGEQCGEVAGQLARHFEQAGLVGKAVHYLGLAGERAAGQAANQEAVAYFSRALELAPETGREERFELLLKRWKIYDHTSQTGREAQDVQALEELAEALGTAYQARAALCRLYYGIDVNMDAGQKQVRSDLIESATGWARESGQAAIEAELCTFQADLYTDPALINPIYQRGLQLARQAGLKGPEANILRAMSVNRFSTGSQARIEYGEQALRLYRQVGDRYGEGYARAMIALGYKDIGDFARALRCFEQSRDICREVGNRQYELWSILGVVFSNYLSGCPVKLSGMLVEALENVRALKIPWLEFSYHVHLADFFRIDGDLVQALDYAEQTKQFYAQSGPEKSNFSDAIGSFQKGLAFIQLDRLEEAAHAFRQSLAAAETSQHSDLFIPSLTALADFALTGLAVVALRQGNPALALEYVEKIWARFPGYDNSDTWTLLTCTLVFQANADPRAGQVLEEAHRVLLGRAAQISDADMRHCFLENVPEHRKIIALWQAAQQAGRDEAKKSAELPNLLPVMPSEAKHLPI